MHQQTIIDDILARLDTADCAVHSVSLTVNAEALSARLMKDIKAGIRQPDIIERSTARIPLYDSLNTVKVDVSEISAAEAAESIATM